MEGFLSTGNMKKNNKKNNYPSLDEFSKSEEFKRKLNGEYVIPERLLKDTIDDSTPIKPLEPVIKIRESNFAVKGDVSFVSGIPKVGKTTICAYMIATAMMKEIPRDFDSLEIRSTYCEGKPIVYFDTEQPSVYTNKLRKQIMKLLGVEKHPKNLHIINLRKYKSIDKAKLVFSWMSHLPDTHLWIVDGVADLIQDPNDTTQAFSIIGKFMQVTEELNTSIVLHLHENPSGNKMRGNLGSEAERKSGGVITLKKKDDIHSIEGKHLRGTGNFDPVYFRWDKDKGGFSSLDELETKIITHKVDPKQIKFDLRVKLAKRITLNGKEDVQYKELVNRIIQHSPDVEGKEIGETTAKSRIKEMSEELSILEKDNQGRYKFIYKEE